MRDPNSQKAWFFGEVPPKYKRCIQTCLPSGFEIDTHFPDSMRSVKQSVVVRKRKRFDWNARKSKASFASFSAYHSSVLDSVVPIIGATDRWYLALPASRPNGLPSWMPVTLAILHRLSELSRYNPLTLQEHLTSRHSWLLQEFLEIAPAQFIRQVAAEITKVSFVVPDSLRLRD
jgi:hypothetical protein